MEMKHIRIRVTARHMQVYRQTYIACAAARPIPVERVQGRRYYGTAPADECPKECWAPLHGQRRPCAV